MLHSTGPLVVVCPFDPALDMSEDELRDYAITRDPALLKIKDGHAPTRFHVRRLPTSKVVYLQRQDEKAERVYDIAFYASVVRVENLKKNDGEILQNWVPKYILRGDQNGHIEQDEIDEFFDMPEVLDIGGVAYWHSFLGGKRPAIFVPPQVSAYAWATQKEFHRLAEVRAQAQTGQPNHSSDGSQNA